jgi:hypothetical protein
MGNDRVQLGDSVEVDLAWSSDLRDAHADEDAETVDVPGDESEGDVRTVTRPDIENWGELSDVRKQIIATAADPTKEWDSLAELAEALDMSNSNVGDTLRKYTPELYQSVKTKTGKGVRYDADFTDEVRRRLLNGDSIRDIEQAIGGSSSSIRKHASEDVNGGEATRPRLEYNDELGTWQRTEAPTPQAELHNGVDQNQMASTENDTTDSETESEPDASGVKAIFNAPDCVPGSACAICQDFYSEREWEFCPFCGNRLLQIPDTEVNNE